MFESHSLEFLAGDFFRVDGHELRFSRYQNLLESLLSIQFIYIFLI